MREEMEKEGAHWGGGLMVVGKDKKERWGDHGEGADDRSKNGASSHPFPYCTFEGRVNDWEEIEKLMRYISVQFSS